MATIPLCLKRLLLVKKCLVLNFSECLLSRQHLCVYEPVRENDISRDGTGSGKTCDEEINPGHSREDLDYKTSLQASDGQDGTGSGKTYDEEINSGHSGEDLDSKTSLQASDGQLKDRVNDGRLYPVHSLAFSRKFQSLCDAGEVDKAHELLTAMVENNTSLKPHYFNSVSVSYAKVNRCDEALEVCNSMRKYGFRPHQTTYHTIMSSYLKQGKVLEALDMFDSMRQDGWSPNEITRSIFAYGLCRTGHAEQLNALFEERFNKSGIVSTSVCNALLESFFRAGNFAAAEELEKRIFSGLCLPNVYTYTTMIRGRCSQGNADEARKLFLEMEKKGYEPILACYGSIISLLCKKRRFKDAYDIFQEMLSKGIEAEGAFCLVLLKQLSMKGMADEALKVCKYVTEKRMYVDDTTFFLILEALSKANRLAEAKDFLENLIAKGHISNVRRFQQALHTLARRESLICNRNLHIEDPANPGKDS